VLGPRADEVRTRPADDTLGNAAAAGARLIVWCWDCRHQTEPDPAELARHQGADTTVLEWRERLVCSQCGSRKVDSHIRSLAPWNASGGERGATQRLPRRAVEVMRVGIAWRAYGGSVIPGLRSRCGRDKVEGEIVQRWRLV